MKTIAVMDEIFIKNKKKDIVHITYDAGKYDKYLQLYCGHEMRQSHGIIGASWNFYSEEYCPGCVGRYKIKNGNNPSWME